MPMLVMKKDQHIRWYVATLGDFNSAHTPHWHGNTVTVNGQRTDVISVVSAQCHRPAYWSQREIGV
jgi:hypothetical protein